MPGEIEVLMWIVGMAVAGWLVGIIVQTIHNGVTRRRTQ